MPNNQQVVTDIKMNECTTAVANELQDENLLSLVWEERENQQRTPKNTTDKN